MSMRRYDWIPDLPDKRDRIYSAVVSPSALPAHVDLRPHCSPVEDQGNLGSCTANAIAGAIEFLEEPAQLNTSGVGEAMVAALRTVASPPIVDASRLFIYYNERVIEHTVSQDAGAMIRDGVKSCAQTGWCNEKLWPYKIGLFAAHPPSAAYNDAAKRKISSYQRVADLNSMKSTLATGFPVIFGFTVYESFESQAVAATGVVPMPNLTKERVLGGHAVLCVGYDDPTQRIIVRNSWGESWAMAGYFTMPYAYITDKSLSDDFWTIRK